MQSIRQTQALNKAELEHCTPPSASWHRDYADTAFIYIGGLDAQLSEGDVIAIFSQYGEPVFLNLVRDKETGKSKGFAFLKYEDQRSCDLAVDNLGGASVLGRLLNVDHTRYKRKEDEIVSDNTWDYGGMKKQQQQRERSLSLEHGGDGDGEGRRRREIRHDNKYRGSSETQPRRKLLKEEEELQSMMNDEENNDDPMKAYFIDKKKEEVEKARKSRHKRRHSRSPRREGRDRGSTRDKDYDRERRKESDRSGRDYDRRRRHRSGSRDDRPRARSPGDSYQHSSRSERGSRRDRSRTPTR